MAYLIPVAGASTMFTQAQNPAYVGIPVAPNGWIPVLDNLVITATNGATPNNPISLSVEGVNIIRHNLVLANTNYYFQDDFEGGFPIYTAGMGQAPALTAIESYTTADNISYKIQGGITGTDEAAAMSWTEANTYKLRYTDINIDKVGNPTDSLHLELRDTSPTGTLRASAFDIPSEQISTTKGYVRFTWGEPTWQTSFGNKQYLVLTRSQAAPDLVNYYRWYGTNTSGMANGGGIVRASNAWGGESGTDDLNWRNYTGYRVLFSASGAVTNSVMTVIYHNVPAPQIRDL